MLSFYIITSDMRTIHSAFNRRPAIIVLFAVFSVLTLGAVTSHEVSAADCTYEMSYNQATITATGCEAQPKVYSATGISTTSGTTYSTGGTCASKIVVANGSKDKGSLYSAFLTESNTPICVDNLPPVSITFTVASSPASGGQTTTGSTCAIDGIGWIICPVVNFLAKIADSSYSLISESFLTISPKVFDTDSGAYKAWVSARNFANAGLIVAFLLIIFSQITNIGITNYGVKKMLPRLLIAAILINISFYIVQGAVDIFNILGKSIYTTLHGFVPAGSDFGDSRTGGGLAGIAGSVLATSAAATGVVVLWTSIAAFIPVAIAGVVALIMIFFVLIAREAVIIMLIIVAPLAFLAFLLPNTESLFTKWRKTLIALLMLYPVISLVFGASAFAASILTDIYTSDIDGKSGFMGQIVAAAVSILPLFVVPGLLKSALNAIPALGNAVSKLSGKADSSTKNAYKNSSFERSRLKMKDEEKKQRDRRYAESMAKGGFRSKINSFSGIGLTSRQRANKDAQQESVLRGARAGVAQTKIDEEKNEDLDFQYMSSGWSKSDTEGYAQGTPVTVTDPATGKTTTHQVTPSARRAAIRKIAPTANSSVMESVALAAVASGDRSIMGAAASVMPTSKAATSAPWLKRASGYVADGSLTPSLIDAEIAANINDGKITPDALLGMSSDEISRISTATAANPAARAIVKSAALQILTATPTSPYAGKVTPGTATHIALSAL